MFQKLLRWLRAQIGTLFGDAPGANDIILSGQMENALALWAQMYETGGPWCTAKNDLHSLHIAASVAREALRSEGGDSCMGVYLGSNAVDMQGGFVTGGASGASLQSKTVSPSESAQTVKADNGYDGLSQVTVNAVSKTYVGSGVTKKSAATYTPGTSDQSIASGQYLNGTQTIKGDSNLTAANIKSGVKIFNVTGSYAGSSSGGNTPNLQTKTVTPSESTQTVSPDSGYDGLSKVTVNAISSTYIGSDVTKKSAATYIPKTTDQSIASGQYLSGTQTIKGDANLVAGNIKSGVSIFGVTGTYTGGGSSGGSGNNNVEAYAVTSTNPSVSFKTASGTIKIWGYGTISSSSGWGGTTTSLIAFDGNKYYKSAVYGSPSSTSLSLSISNGKLTGLPSGLSAISAIVTRGI